MTYKQLPLVSYVSVFWIMHGVATFTGDAVAITDFLLWPLFERSLAKGLVLDSLPKLSGWVERMSILSAVKDVRNSRKGYELYWKSQRSGSTNYDIDV